MDVLNKDEYEKYLNKFDIGIDKGTYDAIGLCPSEPKTKRYLYKEFVRSILKENAYFIICSCNWTSNELIEFFTQDQGRN